MSASISPAASSQQQYFQLVQNATVADGSKTDATKANAPAATTSAETASLQSALTSKTSGGVIESSATRNGDGTYGPKHTLKPPANSVKALEQAASEVGVDVKA